MPPDQIFVGLALITGLATACQVVAPRLRIPALILLLPIGFVAGILFYQVDAEAIFGAAFTPLVNLAVALILFHGGLELYEAPLDRSDKSIVRRLVWLGALITWFLASGAVYWFVGLPFQISVLAGAIVIVSGPTVIGPLIGFVQPGPRLARILRWEGTLIDPVGALIAVIVFQAVQASLRPELGTAIATFTFSTGVGLLAGVIGLGLLWGGLRLAGDSLLLGTQVMFASVILAAGLANALADDAGLVTGILMGVSAPLLVRDRLEHVKPFFDTLVSISIGVLFIAISALVTPESLEGLIGPVLAVVAVLVLISRPLGAFAATAGSTVPVPERAFLAWMAPRGIVAAATAASFSQTLAAAGVAGGDALLPVTFLIIAGTVTLYGSTAVLVANLLKVRERSS